MIKSFNFKKVEKITSFFYKIVTTVSSICVNYKKKEKTSRKTNRIQNTLQYTSIAVMTSLLSLKLLISQLKLYNIIIVRLNAVPLLGSGLFSEWEGLDCSSLVPTWAQYWLGTSHTTLNSFADVCRFLQDIFFRSNSW